MLRSMEQNKVRFGQAHQGAKGTDVRHARGRIVRRIGPAAQRFVVHTERLARDVDAPAVEQIAPRVLPEVRELQRGADRVGHEMDRRVLIEGAAPRAFGLRTLGGRA